MNILFLTHRLPYAPNRGDRIRAYYVMRGLSEFADVELFSLVHDDDEARHAGDVPFASHTSVARTSRSRNLVQAALALPTSRSLTHALLDAPGTHHTLRRLVADRRPDVVVVHCSGMARFALEPPLAGLPFVLDMVDVDSEKWADLSQQSGPLYKWIYRREARTLAGFEARASVIATDVLVVSDRERDSLQRIAPEARIHVMPNGVDVGAFASPDAPSTSHDVVFTGVMDYQPNAQAVVDFAESAWPRVRTGCPDARFTVVGARPTREVLALAERDRSIVVTGSVDAVQPYLWRAAVSVAPLAVARGIQNKVLEALAAGLPAVVSPAVASGLPAGIERGCVVTEEPRDTAQAILALLEQTPAERRMRAASAEVERLSWQQQLSPLCAIVTEAARANPSRT